MPATLLTPTLVADGPTTGTSTTISTSTAPGSTTVMLDNPSTTVTAETTSTLEAASAASSSSTAVQTATLSVLSSVSKSITTTQSPSTTTFPIYNLTTTFTPPTTCLAPTYYLYPDGLDVVTTETYVGYVGSVGGNTVANTETSVFRGVASACFPPHFSTVMGLYSPGVCPSGYATLHTESTDLIYTATCCPTGMLYNAPYTTCLSLALDDLEIVQHSATTTLHAANQSLYLLAPPITVAWQTSDLSLWPSMAASAASAPTAIVTPTSTSAHSGSLSTGAETGLGVGVALGVLALVATVLLWQRKRKLAKSRKEVANPHYADLKLEGDNHRTQAELGDEEALYEVGSVSKPPELESPSVRAELHGASRRPELDSGWRGWEAPGEGRETRDGFGREARYRNEKE